jgi:hypothetical protein
MPAARANQKYCRGGRCRNAAWREEHPRRKRPVCARRRGLTGMARIIFGGMVF